MEFAITSWMEAWKEVPVMMLADNNSQVQRSGIGTSLSTGGTAPRGIGIRREAPNPRLTDIALMEYLRQIAEDHNRYMSLGSPR
jgi:hypothetical protein